MHQLLSYLFLTGGEKCGVIYPSERRVQSNRKELNAYGAFYDRKAFMYELPLFIPQSDDIDYIEYCEEMEKSISNWKADFDAI